MKRLWSPWRMEYIESKKDDKCIFCFNDNDLTIAKENGVLIVLNKYPYNNGHIMIAPLIHNKMIDELNEKELFDLSKGISLGVKIIKHAYNPDAINIGANIGISAGAGISDHLHIHIVPRWNGDTNFMPILFDTKIVSEALIKTCEKLKKAYMEIKNG